MPNSKERGQVHFLAGLGWPYVSAGTLLQKAPCGRAGTASEHRVGATWSVKLHHEPRPACCTRVEQQASALPLHDALRDCEPQSRADAGGIGTAAEALEQGRRGIRSDAGTLIGNDHTGGIGGQRDGRAGDVY